MVSLQSLLHHIPYKTIVGTLDKSIKNIHTHSLKAISHTLFVALKGYQQDGHLFIEQVIQQGCQAIVVERLPKNIHSTTTYIVVNNTKKTLGLLANSFYHYPSKKLKLIAVTGTNGKTSIVHLLYQLFKNLGYCVGMLSTICNKVDSNDPINTALTTPDSLTINRLLYKMVMKGCQYCFMEASSHALVQHRLFDLHFTGAIFSNISHDHLDYHKTFHQYIEAKKVLFDILPDSAFALYNSDDMRGRQMVQNTLATTYAFSLQKEAHFTAQILEHTTEGMHLSIDKNEVWTPLLGKFNAYNLLAVYATTYLLLQEKNNILVAMSTLLPVPGRCQKVVSPYINFKAFVDYAHTPDALENILIMLTKVNVKKKRIITVIGCGGNRDKDKRPIMGSIAQKYSAIVIFTADNPRYESSEKIIDDMQKGLSSKQIASIITCTDRKQAIHRACAMAQQDDILLVAGKGHEKYQEIQGERFFFDDVDIIEKWNNCD